MPMVGTGNRWVHQCVGPRSPKRCVNLLPLLLFGKNTSPIHVARAMPQGGRIHRVPSSQCRAVQSRRVQLTLA